MNKYIVGFYNVDGRSGTALIFAETEEDAIKRAKDKHPFADEYTILYKKEM